MLEQADHIVKDADDNQGQFVDWVGSYWQNDQEYPMDFSHVSFGSAYIKADGQDTVGAFDITGFRKGKKVHFAKKYIGKHTLNYEGEFDDEFKKIEGTYSLGSSDDVEKLRQKFVLKKVKASSHHIYE